MQRHYSQISYGEKNRPTAKIKFVNHWARQIQKTSLALTIWDSVLNKHHTSCLYLLICPGKADKVKGEESTLKGNTVSCGKCSSQKHIAAA